MAERPTTRVDCDRSNRQRPRAKPSKSTIPRRGGYEKTDPPVGERREGALGFLPLRSPPPLCPPPLGFPRRNVSCRLGPAGRAVPLRDPSGSPGGRSAGRPRRRVGAGLGRSLVPGSTRLRSQGRTVASDGEAGRRGVAVRPRQNRKEAKGRSRRERRVFPQEFVADHVPEWDDLVARALKRR